MRTEQLKSAKVCDRSQLKSKTKLHYIGSPVWLSFIQKYKYWFTRENPSNVSQLKQHYVTLTTNCGLEKRNLTMHVPMSHKTVILVKLGRILRRKYPLVFPLTSCDCSVCLQHLILAEVSPATTRCCRCRFSLQAAYMLLSGTSVNYRVEAEQS